MSEGVTSNELFSREGNVEESEVIGTMINSADRVDLHTSNDKGLVADNFFKNDQATIIGSKAGGQAEDQYHRPGMFVEPKKILNFYSRVLEESYRLMGAGTQNNLMQNFLSRIDRHGVAITPINTLNYGYTFITRPRLNMTDANLLQHPVMTTLMTRQPNSVAFMIRCLLDTRLSRGLQLFKGRFANIGHDTEVDEFFTDVTRSGLVDPYNPFFVPLCNGLKGISGFPDFNLETETTEGDFHSGDFTFIKGSDMMNRTQELSLEFRDVQGSVILSCIFFWCLTMACQAKGIMMAYPDDIYEQRLNYTVSIYRFIMDPTRRNILWWAKATGCFPKSAPVGALFNVNQGEVTISSAMNFSIPFTANDIKVNDPGILMDFNRLMNNYNSYYPLTQKDVWQDLTDDIEYNYAALPYIETTNYGLELKWKTCSRYWDQLYSPDGKDLRELQYEMIQDMRYEGTAEENELFNQMNDQ